MKGREKREISRLLKKLDGGERVRIKDVMIVGKSYDEISSFSGEFSNLIQIGDGLIGYSLSREEAYGDIVAKAEALNVSHIFIGGERRHRGLKKIVFYKVYAETYKPRTAE